MKHGLVAVAAIAAISAAAMASPASAKRMSCDGASMAKIYSATAAMPETPGKMAMHKEISMANTDMSKGNMRGACMHMAKAQRMGMTK
jgi:hypothetical protein